MYRSDEGQGLAADVTKYQQRMDSRVRDAMRYAQATSLDVDIDFTIIICIIHAQCNLLSPSTRLLMSSNSTPSPSIAFFCTSSSQSKNRSISSPSTKRIGSSSDLTWFLKARNLAKFMSPGETTRLPRFDCRVMRRSR
jgi:hypothetical protein